MKRVFLTLVALAVIAGAAFWFLTEPDPVEFSRIQTLTTMRSDPVHGEQVFWAGG